MALITDKDTNFVYFSDWIKARYRYWPNIEDALKKHNIDYGFLPRHQYNEHREREPLSRDSWARDYMPLQLSDRDYLGYVYNPDYLREKFKKYISNYKDILPSIGIEANKKTELVIDGGNMVKGGDFIIMTDKIFRENKAKTETEIREWMEELTGCRLVIIPPDPKEKFPCRVNGKTIQLPSSQHADGLVRWVNDDVVVMNVSGKDYTEELETALKAQHLQVERLSYAKDKESVSVNS